MTNQETISRIAKILARATSSEAGGANAAVQSAYKRMERDEVTIEDLLSLPLVELYQESLVKLVSVILENQPNLSPPEKRKAYADYMFMITARFAGAWDGNENQKWSTRSSSRHDETSNEKSSNFKEDDNRASAAREQADEVRRESATRNHQSSPSSPPVTKSSSLLGSSTGQLIVMLIFTSVIYLVVPNKTPEVPASLKSHPQILPPTLESLPNKFVGTHVVVAINANIRQAGTPQSPISKKVGSGEQLELITMEGKFFKVRLNDLTEGYIAQELIIPMADLDRLSNMTAVQYLDQLVNQERFNKMLLQADVQRGAFTAALYGIGNRSVHTKKYLELIESSKKFDIDTDPSAAIWFSIQARAAMASANLDEGFLNASAAVLADPTNADLHVAFALAAFQGENIGAVQAASKILPLLAPMTTNAWMIYGLAQALDSPEKPNDSHAIGSFLLAIKLSSHAANTRKYFRDIAFKTTNLRVRQLLLDALTEEEKNPLPF